MKSDVVPKSAQNAAFWDVFVLKEDGRWLGLRAPWTSLRRVVTLLTLLFGISALGLTGWMLSRWQAGRLERLLSFERLKSISLESQVAELRKSAPVSPGASPKAAEPSSVSVLPALGGEEFVSSSVSIEDSQVGYDSVAQEFHMNFEVVRQEPREGLARYYWILLLHGPQGVMAFPPSLASRTGEALQFHRGQPIEDVKIRRSVTARFKLKEFLESAGSEPVYASLLLYDAKGTLLAKRRHEIIFQRAHGAKGGGL